MKIAWNKCAACLLAAALPAAAQMPAPAGWKQESFDFPLRFAPHIPYEGKEYVAFAPGWDRFDTDAGFSYVFLWDLKRKPFNADDLEDYLETYFDGLMTNVGRAREVLDKKVRPAAAAHPLTGITAWTQAFGAEIRTWNAFSRGEPLLLYGEVTQRDCGERMQVFLAFSKVPRDHAIWNDLRKVRDATTCATPGS